MITHSRWFSFVLLGALAGCASSTDEQIAEKTSALAVACTAPDWDPNVWWTEYSLGDERVHADRLWECINVGWCIQEPGGSQGHFGWELVGECDDGGGDTGGTGGEPGGTGGEPGGTGGDPSGTGGDTGGTGGDPGGTGGDPGGTGGDTGGGPVDACEPGTAPGTGSLGSLSLEGTARWKHAAESAYAMVFDDVCDWVTPGIDRNWQELSSRGLPAAWGAIVGSCESRSQMYEDLLIPMKEAKQEIASHSWTHTNVTLAGTDLQLELVDSKSRLEEKTGARVEFFVFPFDAGSETVFQELADNGYIGARGGNPWQDGRLNSADVDVNDPLADFRLTFDQFPSDCGGSLCSGLSGYDQFLDQPVELMNEHVRAAMRTGGFALRELHGIEDGLLPADYSWGRIPLDVLQSHLDWLVERREARDTWIGTPSEIIRYRRTRAHCPAPSLDGSTINFGAVDAQCQKYATSLSLMVNTTNDVESLYAEQGGECVPTEKLGPNRFLVHANPALGPANVSAGN